MAEYILKNKHKLKELLQKVDLSALPETFVSSNTEEFRNRISNQSNSELSFDKLSKFFILKHIYNYSGKTIKNYEMAITEELTGLLGPNPAHESVGIQRNSGLKFPLKIWTKRTAIIQFSAIAIWIIFLIYLHFKFPDLWIFTFHLPISGIFVAMLPAIVLTLISPRFLGQEKFEGITTLKELVEETYQLNKDKIRANNFAWLNEELKNYVNTERPLKNRHK